MTSNDLIRAILDMREKADDYDRLEQRNIELSDTLFGLRSENDELRNQLERREENVLSSLEEILRAASKGEKISCIKEVRYLSRAGLKEAKEFVEDVVFPYFAPKSEGDAA